MDMRTCQTRDRKGWPKDLQDPFLRLSTQATTRHTSNFPMPLSQAARFGAFARALQTKRRLDAYKEGGRPVGHKAFNGVYGCVLQFKPPTNFHPDPTTPPLAGTCIYW